MRVTPITPEQADEQAVSFDPWPPGDYDFTVYEASEGFAQSSGNEQIKLTLHVFNRQGAHRTVFDYLSSAPKAQWKVRHAAETLGLVRQYETGEMSPKDMIGRPGRLKLRIKPADGSFAANNAVADYLGTKPVEAVNTAPRVRQPEPVRASGVREPAQVGGGRIIEDDIPFAPCVQ